MIEYSFFTIDDVLFFHKEEINKSGGAADIRDFPGIEAAVYAPQASFGGEYLLDVFNMAAAYLVSIVIHHPFIDGNKRTGTVAAITFFYLNGFEVNETHDEELADIVLAFLRKELTREDIGNYFKTHSTPL